MAGLEPLDDVELPQRALAIERAGHDARALVGELRVGARSRQGQLAHVVVEVELRIVGPVGVVEPERHLDEPPAQRRQERHAVADEAFHGGAVQSIRRGRGVEDSEAGHVTGLSLVLEGEELGVEARELSHGVLLLRADRSGTYPPRDVRCAAGRRRGHPRAVWAAGSASSPPSWTIPRPSARPTSRRAPPPTRTPPPRSSTRKSSRTIRPMTPTTPSSSA